MGTALVPLGGRGVTLHHPTGVRRAYPGAVSDNDWRDAPLLPEQTEDDIDREPSDNDDRLREDVPPHHGD